MVTTNQKSTVVITQISKRSLNTTLKKVIKSQEERKKEERKKKDIQKQTKQFLNDNKNIYINNYLKCSNQKT